MSDSPIYQPRVAIPFTQGRAEVFLEHYKSTGRKGESARVAGLTLGQVNEHIKLNKHFAEDVEEAFNAFVEDVLEKETQRRAVDGFKNPIIGGKFRDEVVGHETIYSDKLLIEMLKANSTKYRQSPVPHSQATMSGIAGGVLMLPPSVANNAGEWEKNYGEMAKGLTYMPDDEKQNELKMTGKPGEAEE